TSLPPFEKLFRWDPREGTEVIVVPIDAPTKLRRFHTEAFFQFHFANAFESGDELVVDFIRYQDLKILTRLGADGPTPTMAEGADSAFVRARINPQTTSFCPEVRGQLCEFPQIHPSRAGRSYKYAWMVEQSTQPQGSDPDADQLVCLDVDTGHTRRYKLEGERRTSEPVFVPRSASGQEDDGHLLSLIYDPACRASHIAVFDSQRFEDGPQARLWFDHHVPTTFHGVWVPSST
ncbi:MAG: carotenoid oxygenase family protein, partial [Nannocystaceae bacterium]